MTGYTYTDARQNLAKLLDQAADEGEVRVKRRDGQVFAIRPEVVTASPLDMEGIDLDIATDEVVQFIAKKQALCAR